MGNWLTFIYVRAKSDRAKSGTDHGFPRPSEFNQVHDRIRQDIRAFELKRNMLNEFAVAFLFMTIVTLGICTLSIRCLDSFVRANMP